MLVSWFLILLLTSISLARPLPQVDSAEVATTDNADAVEEHHETVHEAWSAAGHATKHAFATTGHAMKDGVDHAGEEVKYGVMNAGLTVYGKGLEATDAVKASAHRTGEWFRKQAGFVGNSASAFGHGVKEGAKTAWHGTKEAGGILKHGAQKSTEKIRNGTVQAVNKAATKTGEHLQKVGAKLVDASGPKDSN